MLFVYEADAVVVDLHGLQRVFRPLHALFVDHDLPAVLHVDGVAQIQLLRNCPRDWVHCSPQQGVT